MTLTIAENIVHQNSDGVATSGVGTPITVALAAPGGTQDTTDASSVVFVWLVSCHNAGASETGLTVTVPSGWLALFNSASAGVALLYRSQAQGLAEGESSWDFTPSAVAPDGGPVQWAVLEVNGLDPDEIFDVTATATTDPSGGTVKSGGRASKPSSYDMMMLDAWIFRDADNATPATWGSYTSAISTATEVLEDGQAGTGKSVALAISAVPITQIAACATSATASRSYTANEATNVTFTVKALNAPRQTDMLQMDGAEIGQIQGTITGNVTVVSAAKRSGNYGYRFSSSAAACNKPMPAQLISGVTPTWTCFRFHFRVPDLNDRAQIFWIPATYSSGGPATLTFRLTGGQIGLNWSGTGVTSGGEQLSDQTITADQWVGVAVWFDVRTKTALKASWAVDYNAEPDDTDQAVMQTPATANGSGLGSGPISIIPVAGWSSALTSDMDFDDYGQANAYSWPIGDLQILPLKVDPAATPTVLVATTNFGVMTNNGTVAAWNAANARNAIDDIPPVTGGSRDAAVALLAHATDYAEFPLETVDLAASQGNGRGAKAHWWLWAASATTATIRIFLTDGVTVYTLYAEADPSADNTAMVYSSAVIRPSATDPPDWNQTKINNLAMRFGSNDATPDIGIDAFLVEFAIVKALAETLFGEAGDPIYVEAHRDPNTYALVGATVNNNSGDPIKLAWEVDGTPSETASIPDGTAGMYVPLSADGFIEKVNRVSVIPG